jgi:hypothetical protein
MAADAFGYAGLRRSTKTGFAWLSGAVSSRLGVQ